MAPILVTGGAGFAGSHLLDLLVQDGAPVVAWYRSGRAAPASIPGVSWEAVDVLDRMAVREAITRTKPSRVYHCAGAAHVGRSWGSTELTLAVNVRGTHHVIEALRDAGVEARVLIPSSSMVYAPSARALEEDDPVVPSNPYALSKLAQELVGLERAGGPAVSVARAFNHLGPRQDPFFVASGFARRIADIELGRWQPEIAVGNLDARRDMTDVRDTVRAYRLMLERGTPGRIYNVCSGQAVSIRDLLDLMLARARVPISVKPDPSRYRPNDLPIVLGSPRRIGDELGWRAEIPLERTVDDLLGYWRAASASASGAESSVP